MLDILSYLPGKRKQSPSGWVSFNAVCCHHRGEKQDKRGRGGIKIQTDGSWVYSCFNCRFTASYNPGRIIGIKTRKFLQWLGVDELSIERLNLESLRQKSIHDLITREKISRWTPNFKTTAMPNGLELLDKNNSKHSKYVDYLNQRSVDLTTYPFMVSPTGKGRESSKIVIPCTYNNKIVGYTNRYIDNKTPKYLNNTQMGYVFGTDLQKSDWSIAIIVEGVFDALAINGLAVLHNDINDKQVDLIKTLERKIIVLPDRDKAGQCLISKAIELGWGVSFPDWDHGIKDASDAVKQYGQLATLVSIITSVETSKIKIELKRKIYVN